ncbi:MAG: cell division protein ZapB [Calditrichaeota bacterium]|nr:cell division protein ZapB [Calditrichota bacterium]MCB9368146.1 cell division protein ZapB [Calditrichota bacterium]
MDIQTLDALDQKIARLLSKLTELQEENHKMSGELNTLRQQQAQATKDLEESRRRCETLEENQRDPQKEELIRTRISALLEKLEAA